MTAFYDDSGGFDPESGKFACFGMCVVPAPYIRECSDVWWELLGKHFRFSGSLETNGIEAKSSELHDMLGSLRNKSKLNRVQQKMYGHGLDTEAKVRALIASICGFLAKPPVSVKYLAVVIHKRATWEQFCTDQFNQWQILRQPREQPIKGARTSANVLRDHMTSFLVKHAYKYLLQRLQYLSKDPDIDFSDAFVVGDQSSSTKVMLETQAEIQAGLGKEFSDLPTILNRPWWGSSLHDPCLQIADWIASAVRRWAEGKPTLLKHLLPNFRGYPDPDRVIGRGIVLCPDKECFPRLPLEESVSKREHIV